MENIKPAITALKNMYNLLEFGEFNHLPVYAKRMLIMKRMSIRFLLDGLEKNPNVNLTKKHKDLIEEAMSFHIQEEECYEWI